MSTDTLDAALARINSTYKLPVVGRADAVTTKQLTKQWRLQTGIPELDISLGGGYPMGRMEHVIGPFSSGKTMYAMKIAACFQNTCRNCMKPLRKMDWQVMKITPVLCCKDPRPMQVAWLDAEKVFNEAWASRNGVDISSLHYVTASYGEQYVDISTELVETGEIDLLVADSIVAIVPSVELEESAEKLQMGVHAKMVNKWLKKLLSKQSNVALSYPKRPAPSIMLLNQWRKKVGFVMGDPRTSPGGEGPGFFSSVETHVKRVKRFKDTADNVLAQQIELYHKKNKTGIPERTANLVVALRDMPSQRMTAGGIDVGQQVLDLSEKWGIIRKEAAMYHLAKDTSARGYDAALEMVLSNRALFDMLLQAIFAKEKVIQDGGFLEPDAKKAKAKKTPAKKSARPADDDDSDDEDEGVEDVVTE
jgi:recombination protein RecA